MLVLQFVPQADLAVREMRRVTRPGGTVAAATWDTRGGFVALRMIYDAAAMLDQNGRRARAAAYTRPMSRPGDLARAWRDAGLTEVVQDTLTIRMDSHHLRISGRPAKARRAGRGVRRQLGASAKARLETRSGWRIWMARPRSTVLCGDRLGREGKVPLMVTP